MQILHYVEWTLVCHHSSYVLLYISAIKNIIIPGVTATEMCPLCLQTREVAEFLNFTQTLTRQCSSLNEFSSSSTTVWHRMETPKLSCFPVCQLPFLCTRRRRRRRRASTTWWAIYMKSGEDPRLGRACKNPFRIILLNMVINEKALNPVKFRLVAILKEEDQTHKKLLPSSGDKQKKCVRNHYIYNHPGE